MTRADSALGTNYRARGGPAITDASAFWRCLGIEARVAHRRLADAAVAVKVAGGLEPEPICRALEGAGVKIAADADLLVFVTDDYLAPELKAQNELSLAGGGPLWMPVRPTGTALWIGPIFEPKSSFCWACLAYRLRENRPAERFLRDVSRCSGPFGPPRALLEASLQAAVSLAAVHVARFLASGCRGALRESLLTIDLAGTHAAEHPVTKRPQCPACGDRDLYRRRAEQPLFLQCCEDRRGTGEEGSESIEDAAPALDRHRSPITGVLGGSTLPRAGAGAMIEAAARYSGLYHGDEPAVRARASAFGDRAVHPRILLGYSDAQYRDREARNARLVDERHAIPTPYNERREIGWTLAWSLTYPGERRYLPAACCYGNYPDRGEAQLFPGDSGARAAGNCLEEAIFRGLLDLIARDAAALWWYSRVRRPSVDLQSFGDHHFDEIKITQKARGLDLWVLDVTSDLGVPAFAAVARGERSQRLAVGAGCHLDAREGVRRALAEVSRLPVLDLPLPAPRDGAALEEQDYLLPDDVARPRALSDFPAAVGGGPSDHALECVDRLARAGVEALALELTRPDVGLSVARVFAPGLRHVYPRLAPGRLYDAPVRLGWLRAPLREEELNPTPMIWY